jgi:NDP-sugar pyrophosphorylase family protein
VDSWRARLAAARYEFVPRLDRRSNAQSPGPASDTPSGVSLPPALILAGGLGTRLRPAYAAGPKSMAPVASQPFLHYLLEWLHDEGVREVVLCVGHKRSQIRRFVRTGRKWGLKVNYSVERRLLGTGGAIRQGAQMLSADRFLVLNGDTFLDLHLSDLLKFHAGQHAGVTLAAVRVPDAGRYGSLRLDEVGHIAGFQEKSPEPVQRKSKKSGKRLINGGIYLFEKKMLDFVNSKGPVSIEKDVFPSMLGKKNLYAYVTDDYFIDIGLPEDLMRAQRDLPKRFQLDDSR